MNNVFTLFRYELKMLLRDTRMILITVVAPIIILPAFILITKFVEEREEERLEAATYAYMVTGDEAAWADAQVEAALEIDPAPDDTTRQTVNFVRRAASADPDSTLENADIAVLVVGLTADQWRERQEAEFERADSADQADWEWDAPVRAIEIRFRSESDLSRRARSRMQEHLIALRVQQRDSVFAEAGFPVSLGTVASVEDENVATAARQAGAILGVALTPFLLLLMLSGGSIVAADAIAGEKERGTLETLLTSAATRTEIVRAKMLAIIAVGLAVTVINVSEIAIFLVAGLIELPTSLQVDLGFTEVALLLVLLLPVTVLIASALILVSGLSKTYKEYQVYFFPLFLATIFPAMAAALPGIELRSIIALIPISGIAVAVREIMVGQVDIPGIAVAFASTSGLAFFLANRTEEALSTERLISQSELDEADLTGGPALFPRHVLRWFLGMWVLFFVVALWWGEALGLRGQIFVNLVVIFFGGSLFLIRRYRMDWREVFAWRMPHPAAWLAVLIGVPSTLIMGQALFQVVNRYIFPVPPQMLEAFGESLVGVEMPLWQLVLFLCVTPGILEELCFRGVLLHGLSKRLRPVALVLVVGAIFGMFHVSLFRIIPTGFLGVVLAVVTLLTGSILPAMLWHFLNNALAIVPSAQGWIPDDLSFEPWLFVVAALGMVASFWILWVTRTPYPGLRPMRKPRPEG